MVGLDAGTAAMLERWLAKRRKLKIRPGAPLFCTLAGNQLDTSYLRHLFKRLAHKAGVTRRIHPHACRHRFAVDLIQEGANLLTVQQLLDKRSCLHVSCRVSTCTFLPPATSPQQPLHLGFARSVIKKVSRSNDSGYSAEFGVIPALGPSF